MDKPTCKTCAYWDKLEPVHVWTQPAHWSLNADGTWREVAILKPGACKKSGSVQPHRGPEDWCGEHPDFPAYLASLKDQPKPKREE
jgi:hypothetical protein